jgi:hypothetical protein
MVFSSWLSIQPSTDRRYREMLASEAANPGSVSAEEWISSEMDAWLKLLGLILAGAPALIIVTGSVAGFAASHGQRKHIPLFLGIAWIVLGGLLHLLVWNL